MIDRDKWRANRKHGRGSCWNPEKAAYWNKVGKRYDLLRLVGKGIPDTPDDIEDLFVAYASYKHCLYDQTLDKERECYNTNLRAYLTPERLAAGQEQPGGSTYEAYYC
jgi:hypothetical protein